MSTCDPRDIHPGLGVFGQQDQLIMGGDGISISASGSWQSIELNLPDDKNFCELKSRIEDIEKRLAILVPNHSLQERFPALQEAYDHYKLIEKLVNDQAKIHE